MKDDPGFHSPVTTAIAAELLVVIAIFIGAAILTNGNAIFGFGQ